MIAVVGNVTAGTVDVEVAAGAAVGEGEEVDVEHAAHASVRAVTSAMRGSVVTGP